MTRLPPEEPECDACGVWVRDPGLCERCYEARFMAEQEAEERLAELERERAAFELELELEQEAEALAEDIAFERETERGEDGREP